MRSFVNKAEASSGSRSRFGIPLQRPLPDDALKIAASDKEDKAAA
jgi:hypothetical protein